MSIKNNKVREALKSIPSIDEILNYFNSSSLPVAFAKFHINKTLKKIRTDFKNELFIDNPKSHIKDTFQILFNKINRKLVSIYYGQKQDAPLPWLLLLFSLL